MPGGSGSAIRLNGGAILFVSFVMCVHLELALTLRGALRRECVRVGGRVCKFDL